MDEATFPIEFHNELDDTQESEHDLFDQAVERLNKLARGHNDIMSAMVNFKQPAKDRETPYVYEVTVVVDMGAQQIVGTEKHEQLEGTLDGALDAVERQVRERRERQRNY